jgi:hypothetical protein
MRIVVVDYVLHAAECRRLAAQHTTRVEHWAHFREMAETWEMLHRHQKEKLKWREELKRDEEFKRQQDELKQEQEKSRLETIALADQFRDILFLSDTASNGPEADNKEKAGA